MICAKTQGRGCGAGVRIPAILMVIDKTSDSREFVKHFAHPHWHWRHAHQSDAETRVGVLISQHHAADALPTP